MVSAALASQRLLLRPKGFVNGYMATLTTRIFALRQQPASSKRWPNSPCLGTVGPTDWPPRRVRQRLEEAPVVSRKLAPRFYVTSMVPRHYSVFSFHL